MGFLRFLLRLELGALEFVSSGPILILDARGQSGAYSKNVENVDMTLKNEDWIPNSISQKSG